ncbi:MAG: putative nitrogen fixation protein NifT [Hydrogenobacter thermophilus]|nr:putative nitrogen fixation protein NifT [Hydrogenobacter thermophilus]
MKAIFRKNSSGTLEVYIPKKDVEALVLEEIEKEGVWGGTFKLSNGWVIKVAPFDIEPRFPITLEVKKVDQ